MDLIKKQFKRLGKQAESYSVTFRPLSITLTV